jgi:Zn-dependent protease/CBS domain-containing protein
MFGKKYKLFKMLGFTVKVDLSWLIIAILIVWSLATGVFPNYFEAFEPAAYWILGVIGAVGLFLFIILHELSHSLAARKFGMDINEITLFVFGGVANIEEEPPSPKAEVLMALAGPGTSIVLGGIFWGLYSLALQAEWPAEIQAVLSYFWSINFILAGFNLVPAYPLDGGRVLRAIFWGTGKDIRKATKWASYAGSGFGFLLIFIGFTGIFAGGFLSGIWWIFIGFFIHQSSRASYQRVLIQQTLRGEKVRRFMKTEVVTVSPAVSIERLVEDYVYKYHYKLFPIVSDGELEGFISTKDIKNLPREEWPNTPVRQLKTQWTEENTISPDDDATEAINKMYKSGNSRLMVVEDSKLAGILSIKDLLEFLNLKIDLEGSGMTRMKRNIEE